VFRGQYHNTLDAKFRVNVPLSYREELVDKIGNEFVISYGYDKALTLYSPSAWDGFAARLSAIPDSAGPEARAAKRYFLSSAERAELDKSGRFTVPAYQREFAGLEAESEIVLCGVGDHIELWNAKRFKAAMEEPEENIDAMIAKLSEMGFSF